MALSERGGGPRAPIRAIFRKAFEAVGVPYFNPHSFRHALTRHGQTICVTLEDHKAFSQNLGHSSIKTTEMHYGEIPAERQGQPSGDWARRRRRTRRRCLWRVS